MAKRASLGPLVLVLAAASCSLYVACGDDDYILPPEGNGGSGGRGGNGGRGGTGGGSLGGTTGVVPDAGSTTPDASPGDAAVLDDSGTSNDGG